MLYSVASNKKIFPIEAKKSDVKWKDDTVTLFAIGKSECDADEYPVAWIPSYLIEALDKPNLQSAAIAAIANYLAGWESVL